MKPEAIPINLKVILIGDRSMYELLSTMKRIFARFQSARRV